MLTQTDEEALNAALDADPGDMVTRAVLSDLLEEQGRLDEAEGQRWLIREEKWPVRNFGTRWDWWLNTSCFKRLPDHAKLGNTAWYENGFEFDRFGIYRTRKQAEAEAFRYLRHKGLI